MTLAPLRTLLSAALACGASVVSPALAHDHPILRGRLVFGDHEAPVVRILDLDTGAVTQSFDLPKPNPVFAAVEDGRHVVIKTGDASGTVRLLDSGIVRESHGDHDDVEKLSPRLLDLALTGDKPAHVVSANGRIAIFYDGERPWDRKSDPKVVLVDLKSVGTRRPAVDVWKSPAPQHGIAVPLGAGQVLVSVPNAVYAKGEDRSASSRPDGFLILDAKGRPDTWKTVASLNDPSRPEASCRLFHGYAASGGRHVFGCAEGESGGLLVLARKGKGQGSGKAWGARRLAYPDGRRASTIKGGGGRYLVGNYGLKSPYGALLRIDPAAARLSERDVLSVPGDQSACRFEVTANGRRLANLTPDGRLRVYDLAPDWKQVADFEAVPAFDCTYGTKTPTPDLALVGASAFVSDPTNGRIREFHLDTLKQGLDMAVGGKPTALAGGGGGG